MTRAGQLYLSWGGTPCKRYVWGYPPLWKGTMGDGGSMGGRWGADEAGLRARGGPMRRGFVDALDR